MDWWGSVDWLLLLRTTTLKATLDTLSYKPPSRYAMTKIHQLSEAQLLSKMSFSWHFQQHSLEKFSLFPKLIRNTDLSELIIINWDLSAATRWLIRLKKSLRFDRRVSPVTKTPKAIQGVWKMLMLGFCAVWQNSCSQQLPDHFCQIQQEMFCQPGTSGLFWRFTVFTVFYYVEDSLSSVW